jgi:hypothetical protein
MCNAVRFKDRWYNTPAELATIIGGPENIIWLDYNPFRPWPEDKNWKAMDLCLCPVDLAATLTKAGYAWTRGVDPFEWYATKRTKE